MNFANLWALLSPKVEYANRKSACYRLWQSLSEEQQSNIFTTIQEKMKKGEYVDYNPYFAIMNNRSQQSRLQMLSFSEYYAKYGTTEEQDGWKQANPTGERVVYVKAG